jgi:HicB-like protein involved in pilus formation
MVRPKLTERITLRIPDELLADLTAAAERRGVSLNEVALCCFENDLARIGTYRVNYYTHLRPLLAIGQGDNVHHRGVNV